MESPTVILFPPIVATASLLQPMRGGNADTLSETSQPLDLA